jgi:hypothetical protein
MDMKSVGSFYYESFVSVILIVFVMWHTLLLMPAIESGFLLSVNNNCCSTLLIYN